MQINGIDLYRAISVFARRYQFRNRDEVCCYGLTVSQCYALQYLQTSGRTSSELASGLGLDLSSTTRLVDELVKKKLVVRSRDIEDARVKRIELTEGGRKLMGRIEGDFSAVIRNALRGVAEEVISALPEVFLRLNHAFCSTAAQQLIAPEQIRKKIV